MTEKNKEHRGEHRHKEIKKEHKNLKIKKERIWKITTGVLGLLLVISIFTNGFNIKGGVGVGGISSQAASVKAVDYINNYLLEPGTSASLIDVKEEGNLYNVQMDIGGREYDSYITKDGSLLFPSAVDLNQETVAATNTPAPQTGQKVDVSIDDRSIKGPKDAKVTMVEFGSFSCGWCNRVRATLDQILETYPDDVNIVYKHFNRGGTDSQTAQAAECAAEQGKFWEMHDIIFNKGSSGDLKKYAKEIGLDAGGFAECLDSGKYASRVQQDTSEARSYGIGGTPGFIVNGQVVSGAQPFAVFEQIIEGELAE